MNNIPNYVYSTLSLEGNAEDIKLFREKFEFDGKLQATKVIPYPRELELLDKKHNESGDKLTEVEERELTLIALEGKYNLKRDGFNQGGYDWNCKNWGTKWGFCDCEIEDADGYDFMYSFSTAWSPITPVILEMSKQFPKITFTYFCDEESGEFRDERTILNGVCIDYDDRTFEFDVERLQAEEDWKLEESEEKRVEELKDGK